MSAKCEVKIPAMMLDKGKIKIIHEKFTSFQSPFNSERNPALVIKQKQLPNKSGEKAQTKLNAELEMSERNFKNEASQIVNNPATGIADGSVTDDDKQLAAGLFNEAEDTSPMSAEKEKSDVAAMNDEMKNINTEEEFTSVLKKLLDRSESISGMTDTKIKALLMQSIKEL